MLQLERGKAAGLLAKLKGGYQTKEICKVCEEQICSHINDIM